MTRVLVDVDQHDLAQVKEIFGTTKNTEAVRMAIREVIATQARRDLVDMFAGGAFSDLGDATVRAAAWS